MVSAVVVSEPFGSGKENGCVTVVVSEPFGCDEGNGCAMLCFQGVHRVILSML